ncbi:putative membrane protein [Anoxybacillus voinovskiensis]|uniref:Putative membrane protein n=1 Tax=Anoxybacteroides voinovskiense TaxID=230470 RepID=A0A840DXE9_9BACL|nr:DUF975 family protein [Anoxybacillus voinovskiensis]MBB4074189.1 putative membrane protein [Anoxybacillus voinovskiensis]GGJ57294.1 membrane protein [Anoxybacillus voinovskiensis]
MALSTLRRQARQALKGKWGAAVLVMLVYFFLNTIVPTTIEIFASGGWNAWIEQENPPLAASIVNLLYSFALIPLGIAMYWVFLDVYRGQHLHVSHMFSTYTPVKRAFKLIGTFILYSIFVFLWSLLLIIPGIIKALAYSQTFFLLKDHPEYSVLQAITESKKRMKGYKWKLFLLYLIFFGWGLLAILTLGIGLLWLIPYFYTSLAAFYEEFIRAQEINIE